MYKKIFIIISVGILFFIIVGICIFTNYVTTPMFSVVNSSSDTVTVIAYWREQNKNLGEIHPNEKIEFEVKDEAAMSFIVSKSNGQVLKSDPIYFTSGSKIKILINEDTINTVYD